MGSSEQEIDDLAPHSPAAAAAAAAVERFYAPNIYFVINLQTSLPFPRERALRYRVGKIFSKRE